MPERLLLRLGAGCAIGLLLDVVVPDLRPLWMLAVVLVAWRRLRAGAVVNTLGAGLSRVTSAVTLPPGPPPA